MSRAALQIYFSFKSYRLITFSHDIPLCNHSCVNFLCYWNALFLKFFRGLSEIIAISLTTTAFMFIQNCMENAIMRLFNISLLLLWCSYNTEADLLLPVDLNVFFSYFPLCFALSLLVLMLPETNTKKVRLFLTGSSPSCCH